MRRSINLTYNSPYIPLCDDNEVECIIRSDNTFNIRYKKSYGFSNANIITRLNDGNEIMKAILAKNSINPYFDKINLFVPYLPYARQDRICNQGEAFSLKVFADIINAQQFNKVIVFDVHSNVSEILINNLHNVNNHEYVYDAINSFDFDKSKIKLISPDAGAYKKIINLRNRLNYGDIVCAIKNRNPLTGVIDKIELTTSSFNKDDVVIIVDDICDAGRTFFELAIKLKELGASNINLVVSHGIFSYDAATMLKIGGFQNITSTDSFKQSIEYPVRVFDVMKYLIPQQIINEGD